MKNCLFVLAATLLTSMTSYADVPFTLNCSASHGEVLNASFVLMSQPDPTNSTMQVSFSSMKLNTQRGLVDFSDRINGDTTLMRFWEGESQDFYQFTPSDLTGVDHLTLVMEGDLTDLISKSGQQVSGTVTANLLLLTGEEIMTPLQCTADLRVR